jgi:multidrug efflux pump subunit AcrB
MIGPNLSAWSVARPALIAYFMVVALVGGVAAFLGLGRNEDPVFTIKTMVVGAAWPGATVDETLLQVTERLERTLQEVDGLDTLRSFTSAGRTTIFVDLKGSVKGDAVPDAWYDVRTRVGDMRHELPQGVLGPFFDDDFGDTFGFIYGFTADGFTHRELRDYVEQARDRVLQVPDVSKVEILGAQDETIFVEFLPERVASLGLDYPSLFAAIAAQNVVSPAGVVRTGEENVALRVSGAFASEADVLEVNIPAGGRMVRLGDVATVRRGLQDPPAPMFRVNGQPAIGLAVSMVDSGDIIGLGDALEREMRAIRAELPIGIEPALVADQGETVDEAIGDFTESLWQAIAIILAISFLSLGVRPGLVVAATIPLTLAVVFVVMDLLFIDLQRVSLGALIIALGLLVDDAMTTVDAMLRRLAAGDSKAEAASFAYANLAAPMLTGALVTIAGFVPIGFAASSAGEYTFSIFAVVAISLLASWVVAVTFGPVVGMAILKAPSEMGDPPPGPTLRAFKAFLGLALRARWLTILVTVGAFAASIWATRLVPQQFFPASDRVELLVDLSLQQNASIFATEDVVAKLDAALAADEDVERFSAYVGRGAIRFYLPLNVVLPNDFFGQHVVVTKGLEARDRVQARLEKILEEEFPGVVGRVYPLELGPPVGWPVQYRVMGPDPEALRGIAMRLSELMAADPGSIRTHFEWIEPKRQLRIEVDQDQARRLGFSSAQLSSVLNAAVTGERITQVRDGIYLVNVVARSDERDRVSLANLRNLQVPLPNGRTVALSQFATFAFDQELPQVWRRDRTPTLTVRADVRPGVLPETVVARLEPGVASLNADLPSGYRIELAGIAEESAESRASVADVAPLMAFLMLTFLMAQLMNFPRLAMVIAVMPLGLIGVVGALLLSDSPLGFVAILGILALIGMIAKNATILIVQIDADRASGLTVREAVETATVSRFRPMMLTGLSTILGLIPIAPTVFWGPMAFAIMGGLLVATLLTLVFLPALYLTALGHADRAAPAPASVPAE